MEKLYTPLMKDISLLTIYLERQLKHTRSQDSPIPHSFPSKSCVITGVMLCLKSTHAKFTTRVNWSSKVIVILQLVSG